MNAWLNLWIPCLLIALVLQIIYIYEDIDINNIDKLSDINKVIIALLFIVYLVGIILFIIWLFKYDEKIKVLMYICIGALIVLIASIFGIAFLDNEKLKNSFNVISVFSTLIFFGTLIAFFVKKPNMSML